MVTHPRTVTIRPTARLKPLIHTNANVFAMAKVTLGSASYPVADAGVNFCVGADQIGRDQSQISGVADGPMECRLE